MSGVKKLMKTAVSAEVASDDVGSSTAGLPHGTKTRKRAKVTKRSQFDVVIRKLFVENRKVLKNQAATSRVLVSTLERLGKSIEVLATHKGTDDRPADTKVLNSVMLEGTTARDLINFCQIWLRISKDKVRFEARYDYFGPNFRAKALTVSFDSIFTETVDKTGGEPSNERSSY
jgi:hypothetical protein